MKTKQDIIQWLTDNSQQFIDMADAIWEKPELAFKEFFASSLQADFLKNQGFSVKEDIAGMNTAFIAEWGNGKPIIGFIGEYDALPKLSQKKQAFKEADIEGGNGHGCGHNLLGTGHIAAITAIKHWMTENSIKGTIRYYGCPAEEEGGGKTFMVREGLFDDVDAAFNFHPFYANTASKGRTVGVNTLKFLFHGKSSHAGAYPHLGRSALDGVELLNVGINYLREHITDDVRIHYSITNGGGAPNVVPAEAEGMYMIRALYPDNLADVTERVRKIAQGAAMMTETQVEEVFVGAVSSMINNHYLADLQYSNMKIVGPIQWTDEEIDFAFKINDKYPPGTAALITSEFGVPIDVDKQPILGDNYPSTDEGKIITGSTDVGDASWTTPISMLCSTCWTLASVGHSWGVVATSGMSIGHKGMMHAAKVMALSCVDLMVDPKHLECIKAEFDRVTNSHSYKNPIPININPPRY